MTTESIAYIRVLNH